MLGANEQNVLGKFDNTEVTINGVTTLFYKKGEAFWVKTESQDGSLKDFKIEFTFGFTPLQQYIVKTDNGRYQVLPISWDNRPEERGGQRWFHIYGNDHIPHTTASLDATIAKLERHVCRLSFNRFKTKFQY